MQRVAILLLLAALCACTRIGTHSATGGNAWTVPGVLRIGDPEEPDNLNLMFGHTLATGEIDCLLFSFILRTDAEGNLFPDLATRVPTQQNGDISRDGKTITIHLRHGVKWSDGAPLTAADWLFTYHAVLNPANNTKTDYGWSEIASAEAPDPYTIVMHLKRPTVEAIEILTMGGDAYPPLPAHLLAKLPDLNHAAFNSAPISSGPFVLKRWDRGSKLVFVANPLYFRGAPGLKEIDWNVIPSPTTLLNALRAHQIDLYPSVSEDALDQLGSISGIVVTKRLVAYWQHLNLNMSKPGLADPNVRAAIAEGVDWKRIVDTIYRGAGDLAVSDIFPQSWAAPNLPPYRYDPADAKRLLAKSGRHDLHFTISATTDNEVNERAELLIQSMLQQVGIGVEIHNYPANLLFAQNGPIYTGKYDMEWSQAINGADPDDSGSWNSAYIPPHGANTSWLRDPIVDRTTEAAASTFDQRARKALYQKEWARIRQLNPSIIAFWHEAYYAYNSDLKNFKPAAFIADSWNAWEWQI